MVNLKYIGPRTKMAKYPWMAESVRIQKGKARIPGRPNRYFFKKGKQGFMDNRIGPDFKGECRGPWTAESARILKRGFKNPGTAESVQIFKGLGAGDPFENCDRFGRP